MKLLELPNIGKALLVKLEKIEIKSVEDLRKAGSKETFLKIRRQLNDG